MVDELAEMEREEQEERREIDIDEERKLKMFVEKGCGYAKECSKSFTEKEVMHMKNGCSELRKEELDMLILGEILTCTSYTKKTVSVGHVPPDRGRPRSSCMFTGYKVFLMKFAVIKNYDQNSFCRSVEKHFCSSITLESSDWMPLEPL